MNQEELGDMDTTTTTSINHLNIFAFNSSKVGLGGLETLISD